MLHEHQDRVIHTKVTGGKILKWGKTPIRIFTYGFGQRGSIDEGILKEIATENFGTYQFVADGDNSGGDK